MTGSSKLDRRRVVAAEHQSFFREVNERIAEVSLAFGEVMYVCECRDVSCSVAISLSPSEYESIRSQANSFFVAPGHEVGDVEDVVGGTERYTVVRTIGVGASVAARWDPRRRQAASG